MIEFAEKETKKNNTNKGEEVSLLKYYKKKYDINGVIKYFALSGYNSRINKYGIKVYKEIMEKAGMSKSQVNSFVSEIEQMVFDKKNNEFPQEMFYEQKTKSCKTCSSLQWCAREMPHRIYQDNLDADCDEWEETDEEYK
jgi:hypothetical protein